MQPPEGALIEATRTHMPARRPGVDRIMLALMVGLLLVGIGRFAFVSATVAASPSQSERGKVLSAHRRLTKNPAFVRWWGGRPVPHATGNDYLVVMRERSTLRTLGPILGTVIERQKAAGTHISQVVVPVDNDALLGGRSGAVFTTAEGTKATTKWAPVGIAAANLTGTPLTVQDYAPVLSREQWDELSAKVTFTTATRYFRVGRASGGNSDTWILLVHDLGRSKREFLLVPIETMPVSEPT